MEIEKLQKKLEQASPKECGKLVKKLVKTKLKKEKTNEENSRGI